MKKENYFYEWKKEILEIIHEECKKIKDGCSEQANESKQDNWKNRLILSLQDVCEGILSVESKPTPDDSVLSGYFGNFTSRAFNNCFSILLQGALAGDPELLLMFAEHLNYRFWITEIGEYNLANEVAWNLLFKCLEGEDSDCETYPEHHTWTEEMSSANYDDIQKIWKSDRVREWRRNYLSPMYWYKQAAEAGSDMAKLWCAYCMDTGSSGFQEDHPASDKMLASINDMPDSLSIKGFDFLLITALRLEKECENTDLLEDELCVEHDPAEKERMKKKIRRRPAAWREYRDILRILMANLGLLYSLWEEPYYYKWECNNDDFYHICQKIITQKGNWYRWCLDRNINISLM